MNIKKLFILFFICILNSTSILASDPNKSWLTMPASKIYNEANFNLDYEIDFNTHTQPTTASHRYNSDEKILTWYPFQNTDKIEVKITGKNRGLTKISSIKIELLTFNTSTVFKTYNLTLNSDELVHTQNIIAQDVPASSSMRLRITLENSLNEAVEEYIVRNKLTLYSIANNDDIGLFSLKTYTVNAGEVISYDPGGGCRVHIQTQGNPTRSYIHGRDDINILYRAKGTSTVLEGSAPTLDLPDTIDLISNSHIDRELYRVYFPSEISVWTCPSPSINKKYIKYYKLVYESKPSSIDDGEGHEFVSYVKSDSAAIPVGGGPSWHRKLRYKDLVSEFVSYETWNHNGEYW